MAFGDAIKKYKYMKEEKLPLETTTHVSFHLTGDGVNDIGFYKHFEELGKQYGFKVTSGHINYYVSPYKEKLDAVVSGSNRSSVPKGKETGGTQPVASSKDNGG